jgi:diacylglycerol O-acyltransferase / wax synthase
VTALYAFYRFLIWRTDENCLKQKNATLVGKKVNSISMPLDVASLKKIGAHFNKATINDVVLALVSVSLKEYFVKHQDTKNTTINMLTPFSLRKLPDTIEEHRLVNDFTLMCFTLDLTNDFEKAIGLVQKQTRALKKSIYPFGVLSLTQFIATLPSIVGQLIMMWVISKATLVMSNVPGPKGGLVFGGAKCVGFCALVPGLGDLAFGITALSMGETMYMAV